MKILYKTITENGYTIKYYLTKEAKSDLLYYGIMLISSKDNCKHTASISEIFPYEHNAVKLLMYLHSHNVTPLSMKDIVTEYIDEKFVLSE